MNTPTYRATVKDKIDSNFDNGQVIHGLLGYCDYHEGFYIREGSEEAIVDLSTLVISFDNGETWNSIDVVKNMIKYSEKY